MEETHLFPDAFYTEPLETWVAALLGAHPEAEQCLLEQVVHYKALSGMEHEFLIVHASHPSGRKIVLGVDRNAEALPASCKPASSNTICTSSSPSSSSRYLSKLMNFKSSPSPSSSSKPVGTSPRPAIDAVQVSHDGTPDPILVQHGRSVPLSTISFTPPPDAAEEQERPRTSLLDLSTILLAIHGNFPSYGLLQHQCYFFARETCLTLIELYGGMETVHSEGRRAETWCGVHVSFWSAASAALPKFLLVSFLPTYTFIIPAGLFVMYRTVAFYKKLDVQRAFDRLKIKLTCCLHSNIARLTFG